MRTDRDTGMLIAILRKQPTREPKQVNKYFSASQSRHTVATYNWRELRVASRCVVDYETTRQKIAYYQHSAQLRILDNSDSRIELTSTCNR